MNRPGRRPEWASKDLTSRDGKQRLPSPFQLSWRQRLALIALMPIRLTTPSDDGVGSLRPRAQIAGNNLRYGQRPARCCADEKTARDYQPTFLVFQGCGAGGTRTRDTTIRFR